MGDRTYVTVSINKSYFSEKVISFKEIEEIRQIDNYNYSEEEILKSKEKDFDIELGFQDVNYGIDDELIDFLCSKNVEFNYNWDAGCEYGSGFRYYRYSQKDKEIVYDEFYDDFFTHFSFIKSIKDLPANELKAKILEVYDKEKQHGFSDKLPVCSKAKFLESCKEESI